MPATCKACSSMISLASPNLGIYMMLCNPTQRMCLHTVLFISPNEIGQFKYKSFSILELNIYGQEAQLPSADLLQWEFWVGQDWFSKPYEVHFCGSRKSAWKRAREASWRCCPSSVKTTTGPFWIFWVIVFPGDPSVSPSCCWLINKVRSNK